MTLPKTLRLHAWAPEIDGTADALTIKWEASKKTGTRYERTKVELTVDRYVVRQLAEQIMKMQARDRERLAHEADRLLNEIRPITEGAK